MGAQGGKGGRGVDLTGGRVAGHLDNSELGGEEMSDRDGLAATLSLILVLHRLRTGANERRR